MKKSIAVMFAMSLIFAEESKAAETQTYDPTTGEVIEGELTDPNRKVIGKFTSTKTKDADGKITVESTFVGQAYECEFGGGYTDESKDKKLGGHLGPMLGEDYRHTCDSADKTLPHTPNANEPLVTNTSFVVGGTDENGKPIETKLYRAVAGGVDGYIVTGNKAITLKNGAETDYLFGAYDLDGDAYDWRCNQPKSGVCTYDYNGLTDPGSTINVTVEGGAVVRGELYGANYVGSNYRTNTSFYKDGNTYWHNKEAITINLHKGAYVRTLVGAGFYAIANNSITIRSGYDETEGYTGNDRTVINTILGGSYRGSAKDINIDLKDTDVTTRIWGAGQESTAEKVSINLDNCKVGEVYAGGLNCTSVTGSVEVSMRGETKVTGVVSGASYASSPEFQVAKPEQGATLYVGDDKTPSVCTVGKTANFDSLTVAKTSTLTQTHTDSNIFDTKVQTYTLSSSNLTTGMCRPAVIGATANSEEGLTLTIRFDGNLNKSGKYILASLTELGGPEGWDPTNVTVKGEGAASGIGYDDLKWEQGPNSELYNLYLYWTAEEQAMYLEPEAMLAANWAVFKSSHLFTGTLWGDRSNAVELSNSSVDAKGRLIMIEPTGKTLAWASVYGHSSTIDGNGADYSLYGGVFGVERRFVSGRSIGAAVGYDTGEVSPFTYSAVEQETVHAALYGRLWYKPIEPARCITVDWSVAYGKSDSEAKELSGSWSQDSWQFDVRATYSRAINNRLTGYGFVGLQYYTHDSASVEGMEVSGIENARVMVGGGLSYAVTGKLSVFGEASVYRDVMRENPYVEDADGKRCYITNPGRTGVELGVGTQYSFSEKWALRGGYSLQKAEDSTEHNVNVGAVYTF